LDTQDGSKGGNAAMPIIVSEIKVLAKESSNLIVENQQMEIKDNGNNSSTTVEQYDYYISYAPAQLDAVTLFINALKEKDKTKKIFFDKESIPLGSLWIKQISDAIENSKQFICIMSPQYSESSFCWDEFQCAKLKEYNTKQSVIKVIYFLKDINLPSIMAMYSYIDCTEGDVKKLAESVNYL
jgi:hypothetical protein